MKIENTNKTMQNLKNERLIELTMTEIKDIQTIILEMINDLDKIFCKNDISYYLGGGSALGSIRHKGFIPWDDDMDINVQRSDCDKIIKLFKQNKDNINKKYYLCDNTYDGEFDVNFLRIKLKGTSFKEFLYEDYSKDGIFIDIFPIENMFNNKIKRTIHGLIVDFLLVICSFVRISSKKEKYLKFEGNIKYSKTIKKKAFIGKILSFRSLNYWLKLTNKVMRMCKDNNSKYISIPTGKKHFFGEMYLRKDIFPVKYKPFENIKLPVANKNEKYMEKMFGDYMKIPEIEDRERHFICSWSKDIKKGESKL